MTEPASQHAYWNSPISRTWATEHARIDACLAPLGAALHRFADIRPGQRVLEVGCATGGGLLALAAAVGPAGRVLGVDIAEASVAVAEARIAAAGLSQAAVLLADAGRDPLPPAGFDLLYSRFGVMFFEDPAAAFANLRRALAAGGRVAMLAWRSAAENPWASLPRQAVAHLVGPVPAPGPEEPGPEEPGPFAFADPDRVRRILEGAGFAAVGLEPLDLPLILGADAAEAAEFTLTVGPTRRGLAALPEQARAAAEAAVRAALVAFFQPLAGPGGVAMPSATWLIGATAGPCRG